MLHNIADSLEAHEAAILAANARDVAAAEQRRIDAVLLQRLRLRPEKLRTLARGIRAIAGAEEPLQKVLELQCPSWLTGWLPLAAAKGPMRCVPTHLVHAPHCCPCMLTRAPADRQYQLEYKVAAS